MRDQHIDKHFVDTVEIPAAGAAFHWDDKIKGLGLKVTSRGRKVFILQYRADPPEGSEKPKRNTPTKRLKIGVYPKTTAAEARSIATTEGRRIRKDGADPQAEKTESKKNTFRAARIAFIAEKRKAGRSSADEVSGLLERLVGPAWDHRPLAEITRKDAKKLIGDIKAPIVANRVTAHLKTLFYWAVGDERIQVSPMAGYKRPNPETQRKRTPTFSEIGEIWRAATGFGYPFEPALKLLILIGKRHRHVTHMRWSELDLDAGTWRAPPQKRFHAQNVPLAPVVVAILRGCRRSASDLVFTTNGKVPYDSLNKRKVERLEPRILEARHETDPEAQAMPGWTPHDFRRSLSTHLNTPALNIHPDVIESLEGRVVAGVRGVYNQNLYWNERKKALEIWSAAVMEAVTK